MWWHCRVCSQKVLSSSNGGLDFILILLIHLCTGHGFSLSGISILQPILHQHAKGTADTRDFCIVHHDINNTTWSIFQQEELEN